MVCSARRRRASHRSSAPSASSSTACRAPFDRTADGTRRDTADSFTSRASPRECAGSRDTIRTRCPPRAAATAAAAAHVVFPTPPLPAKNRNTCRAGVVAAPVLPLPRLVVVAQEGRSLGAGHPHPTQILDHRLAAPLPDLDLTQPRQQVPLGGRKILLGQ